MTPETLFNEDPLDPEAAKIADKCVTLTKEFNTTKEKRDLQFKLLLGLMRKTNRSQIRHGGYIIKIAHKPESDKLQVLPPKTEKKPKTTRPYHAVADK